MTTNLDRFKQDIERLIQQGALLKLAMQREIQGEEAFIAWLKKSKVTKIAAALKNTPDFKSEYEAWYSESLALLRQILPDRVQNFISMYEKPKGRKEITYGNYVIQDFLQGLVRRRYDETIYLDTSAAFPQFEQQLAIVKAAEKRFSSSLFEIRQLVQADLLDSEIEAARELHKHKFLRAAGAVAGVVLEKHLRQVCDDHKIKIVKKHPGIGDLNELLKKEGVIEVPQWRHITLLADLRNLCDHNKQKEPSPEQITDLIDGTEKILKTVA